MQSIPCALALGTSPMNDEQSFLVELRSAIASGSITLPTLPDVAIKVRDAVDGESASAREIAEIVTTDPSISVRLLQVANSPLYRGRTPIEDVHTAIGRLGTRMVRSLVTSLAMQGLYNAASGALDRRFRKQWEMSVEVAGMSRVLARLQPQLNAEQGMLAGLIHSIGTLPILVYAESIDELNHDEEQLDTLLERLSPLLVNRYWKPGISRALWWPSPVTTMTRTTTVDRWPTMWTW